MSEGDQCGHLTNKSAAYENRYITGIRIENILFKNIRRSIRIHRRHLPHREENLRHAEEGQDAEKGYSRQNGAHRPGNDPEEGDDVVGNQEAMKVSGAP